MSLPIRSRIVSDASRNYARYRCPTVILSHLVVRQQQQQWQWYQVHFHRWYSIHQGCHSPRRLGLSSRVEAEFQRSRDVWRGFLHHVSYKSGEGQGLSPDTDLIRGVIPSIASTIIYNLPYGGPVSMVWGWAISAILIMFIGLAMVRSEPGVHS